MHFDFVDVAAAFTRTVEKNDQRPFFCRLLVVTLGQGKQIIKLVGTTLLFFKGDGFLIRVSGQAGEQSQRCGDCGRCEGR